MNDFCKQESKRNSSDAFFESWGFQEICGVIDIHWTLKKTKLLNSCVKEL
jgi:hypothetical protein